MGSENTCAFGFTQKSENKVMKPRISSDKQEDQILKRLLEEEQKEEKKEYLEQQMLELQQEERQKQRKPGRIRWKSD
jgi:hypothetical protein